MRALQQSDIVKVPFPYTDRSTRQRRPALVLATVEIPGGRLLLWVVMITSAANQGWPGDVPIERHRAAGLPIPSVVRTAKLATIDAWDAERIGRVPDGVGSAVLRAAAGRLRARL